MSDKVIYEGNPQSAGYKSDMVVATIYLLTLFLSPIGLYVLINRFITLKTLRYSFTSERLEVERGLLTKKIDNLELWRVNDIRFSQGLVQRIFGECSLVLTTQDQSHPTFEITGFTAETGRNIYNKLKQAITDSRKGRQVVSLAS